MTKEWFEFFEWKSILRKIIKFDLTFLFTSLNKLCIHNTLWFYICQEKLYDKIPQIPTETSIPIKSPISAAASTNLIFFDILHLEKSHTKGLNMMTENSLYANSKMVSFVDSYYDGSFEEHNISLGVAIASV